MVAPVASDRFADAFCLLFGVWTVICQLAILAGVGLDALLVWTLAAAVAGIWTWCRSNGDGSSGSERPLEAFQATAPEPKPAVGRPIRLALGLAPPVLLSILALAPSPRPWVLWAAAVTYFALAAALAGGLASPAALPRRPEARQGLVWGLALAAVLLTWTVNRPDEDDAFYLGIAVAAADFPDQPLLRDDPVHGVPGVPIQHPAYRLHTLEILAGGLTRVTGIAAIYWLHFALSGIGAALLVFGWARLLRLLAPGRWLWTLAALVLILCTVGDVHRWYGNFAFVRLFQGKAVFLSALVPLTIVYALELALAPGWRRWLRLAWCQVAAVGLTSTAIWIAPAVAGLALLAASGLGRRGLRTVCLGSLASFYPLLAGAVLAVAVQDRPPRGPRVVPQPIPKPPAGQPPEPEPAWSLLGDAGEWVLGDGALIWCVALATALAWWLADEDLVRRVSLVFPLGFLICLFNPVAADLTVGAVGQQLYWRAFWVLPIPLFLALCLTAPMARGAGGARRHVVVALLLGAFVVLVPERQLLTRANRVSLRPFQLKVPVQYPVAEALARAVPPGAPVLAPRSVSPWVVTMHHHPSPLVVRLGYLPTLHRHLGALEVGERRRLASVVTGKRAAGAAIARAGAGQISHLVAGIARFDLRAVCWRTWSGRRPAPGEELSSRGFERVYRDPDYEIWRRAGRMRPR